MKKYLHIRLTVFVTIFFLLSVVLVAWQHAESKAITWKFDSLESIGGIKPNIWSHPQLLKNGRNTCIAFDGADDALIFDTIPIQGWKEFTIEVLIYPDADGPHEPRFMHFEDSAANRGTMEMRITEDGNWYLDCFLKNGDPSKPKERLTLIDSTLLHPCGRWYWVAMTYREGVMTSCINAKKELQGKVEMPAMQKGQLSVGVRLNKVNWFKGKISEIRFHDHALRASELQH